MTSRALALTLVVAGAACTGGASAPVTTAPPTTAPSPSPVASPATTEPVVTSTETFGTFLPEPMELTDQVVDYNGGASLGDSYYPELGNAGYDVTHVGLDVDLRTAEQGRFTGVATLHITPLEPLETFVIDTGTVVVSDVWEVTTHTPDEWVRSRWARESATEHRIGLAGITDEPFEVRIEYRGVPEPVRHPSIPLELGLRPGPDSWFAVSEPVGATTWFPANDHPRDKATYTIRLTVPAGMEGIAGGLLTDTQAAIGGGSTFTWEFRQPVASYLVGLAVGEFTRIDRDAVGDVTLRDYVDPDAGADLGGLDRTGEILTWMTEVFGPYPFDAYGTLVVDTAFGGALENQTLAIHDPGALSTTVIVHEMAHQWFGNSVSLCDWSDVWLNEGFATYVEWLWVEHDRGSDLYEAIARQGFERYLELPAPGRPPRDDLFNGGVYLGGATVLHHLRAELGDGPFFALLRTYAAEFAHGNASTAEFVDMAERFAARQLDEFFDTWLSGSGEAYVPLR